MNTRTISAALLTAAMTLTLTACGGGSPDSPAAAETYDTGIAGVVVPGDVENPQSSGETFAGKLPDWKFEDATEWMGDHLSDEVDGMPLKSAARLEKAHEWCYSGDANEAGTYRMVYVYVGEDSDKAPVSVSVTSSEDDPSGC